MVSRPTAPPAAHTPADDACADYRLPDLYALPSFSAFALLFAARSAALLRRALFCADRNMNARRAAAMAVTTPQYRHAHCHPRTIKPAVHVARLPALYTPTNAHYFSARQPLPPHRRPCPARMFCRRSRRRERVAPLPFAATPRRRASSFSYDGDVARCAGFFSATSDVA